MGQETLEQLAATLPNDLAQYVVEDNEAFQKEIVEEELTSVPALIPVNSSECRHWWGGLFDNSDHRPIRSQWILRALQQ